MAKPEDTCFTGINKGSPAEVQLYWINNGVGHLKLQIMSCKIKVRPVQPVTVQLHLAINSIVGHLWLHMLSRLRGGSSSWAG